MFFGVALEKDRPQISSLIVVCLYDRNLSDQFDREKAVQLRRLQIKGLQTKILRHSFDDPKFHDVSRCFMASNGMPAFPRARSQGQNGLTRLTRKTCGDVHVHLLESTVQSGQKRRVLKALGPLETS